MYRFQPQSTIDLTSYVDPGTDRSGPPLSQGFVLTLISTVASEYCEPDMLTQLEQTDPNSWYHGQVLEAILDGFEARDAELPAEIGKNIYYTLQSQFRSFGIASPEDVVRTLPSIWQHVTRGASGEWRLVAVEPGHARFEVEQPYNCRFEQGALQGALEAFDARNVRIEHAECMRNGSPFCVFAVNWEV